MRKLLRRFVRWVFGNSNRSGHLRMSRVAAFFASIAAFTLGYWLWADPVIALSSGMVGGIACLWQERWASADRDLCRRGYWAWFGGSFSHRGLSHSPLLGTVIRLLYGYMGLPFLLLWLLPPVGAAWLVGALVNDAGHLLLDI